MKALWVGGLTTCLLLGFASLANLRAELLEEEDRIIYRSGPPEEYHEDLKAREEYREEQSWRMLRDLVVIPPIHGIAPAPDAPKRPQQAGH